MKTKLFSILTLLLCVCSGAWGTDIVPSFIEGYTTTYDVSTNVAGLGNIYFASRSGITKNTPTDHTNYRTPKGNFVFELSAASTIEITFYTTSTRNVKVGLYSMDETTFQVWEGAADTKKNMLTWLIDNKANYAADGVTTLESYYSDKLKQSSKTIASGSDNEKALMPEATSSAEGMTAYAKNLYTQYWYPDAASAISANSSLVYQVNGGTAVPAGKYIMTIGDSGSNVGIEKITITPAAATYSVTHTLTNVTATSGETGSTAATENTAYNAVFAANSGYSLPSTIAVTIGGETASVGTDYTWNAATGEFQVPAAKVTGNIVVTISGDALPTYEVTYKANGGVGADITDDAATEVATCTFTRDGFRFTGWNTSNDGSGTAYAVGDAVGSDLTLYAQWEEIAYYTVTLNPNGGTIDDATGWTLDNGQYKKTGVEEGTELTLPTFTKTDCTLMTWRDDSDSEYSSPVTVTSNLAITAIWGKEKERVIYSWESPSGTAVETGGTATHYHNTSAVEGNTRVNYLHSDTGNYTISLNGKNDYSTDHIRIALSENIKTGDEVKVTAYCFNSDNTKTAAPKMNTQDGTPIFTKSESVVNIYSSGSPAMYTFTVPSGINTNAVKMTRNLTETATFITKLQIVRTEIVEEQDPCETPTITAQPADADYEWSDVISPLTVTASVSDGGTLSYQWYKKGSPNVEVGTNSSSYTPSEAGMYFVVVTNSKDGYEDASTTSSDAVITITEQPAYGVTFSAGEGSGTVPTETDKVDGAQFTLPGQGSMVAPANKYFTGWNDGTDDYAEGATYTMPAEAVTFTALWTALPVATANHYKYSYKDAQHYVNSTYRNPRGGIAVSGDNQSIPNGNLCESLGGITSVAITSAQYDGKGTHMDAYLKIATGGSSKVTITIASGYVGTLTLKANGYSANAGISVSDAVKVSGSEGGVATAEDNFNALVYTLYPGAHNITCSSKNMYISEMDIVTEEVTSVPVTVAESGWTSLASAYALDFANAEDASSNKNLKAYVISDITSSAVTLTSVESAPAETGLILKGTASTAYTIPVSASPASITTNELSAAVTATAVETESVYVVSGGELKLFTGTEIPAGKAYLLKSKVDAVGARSLSFIFDDETTGISNVENSQRQLLDGDFYNLAGQRVAAPAKGMYIVNGRKVVIK